MLPISPEALAGLSGVTQRPARAEWSNDGGRTWTPAQIGSGTVTPDRTAEVRYSASVELLDVPLGRGGINTEATQVRLWQGIKVTRRDVEWIPAGRYVIDRQRQTRLGATLELLGREDVIRGAAFPVARTIGPDTARHAAEQLVGEALPDAAIAWRPGVNPDLALPAFVVDEDRWAALSAGTDSAGTSTGIAAALAGEVWLDARGIVTFGPVPTIADDPVWRVPLGVAMVEPVREQSAEGIANVWSVSGDGGDGAPAVGPAHAWDDDPLSLTYAGPDPINDPLAPQRLGLATVRVRTERHSSALITSFGQAAEVARAKLADSLGVQTSLSFTAACNPALEPGDVVLVETESGMWERHVIDSCPFDLGGVTQTCATRTTTRRT
ncbi:MULTISPECIES: phage tail protein [Streptomyces]|uniref:phage tail protein n=1 Tax=Streptomyces lycopersici TaxID=2974589 RepID=UPI0021D07F92|nr:phage tail protein [Streptomyces sp. NEAU-383]